MMDAESSGDDTCKLLQYYYDFEYLIEPSDSTGQA